MNREAHARHSVRQIIAMARRRMGMRGRVVRVRSLTATTARVTRRSMAKSMVVKVRSQSVTGAASDSAD